MLTFAKRLLFVFFLLLLVLFVYQNLEPLSQTTQFSFDLSWWGSQDHTSEESPDAAAPEEVRPDSLRLRTPEMPNMLLFLVFFFFGMLAAGVHSLYERIARRVDVRKRDKRIRELEKELGELRAELIELKPAGPPPEPIPEPDTEPADKLAPPQPSAPAEDAPTL